ncbi:MAG: TonB-dependent receptor plug domain-containing protein, partial [Bacteroidota bacterium]
MNKKQIWAVALGFVATSMYAQNQSQDSIAIQALDEVVVSDSRFALKRENSGKTVITISRAEIERNQGRTVPEIINIKSGIEIAGSRGRDGSVLGVFARGGRGRQVLVVIDGVRVSDPSSFSQEYDLRLLSTNAIESIEIIKGAASTLYGTNAATAVINITTKKASKESISADFQATVGTNQTSEDQNYNLGNFANSAAINGTLNRFFYNVDFSNRYSSGISAAVTPENEEDVFSQYSGNLKLGYRFSDSFELSIYGNTTRLDTDFDASGADAPNSLRSDQERFGLASLFKYGKGSVHLNTAFTD